MIGLAVQSRLLHQWDSDVMETHFWGYWWCPRYHCLVLSHTTNRWALCLLYHEEPKAPNRTIVILLTSACEHWIVKNQWPSWFFLPPELLINYNLHTKQIHTYRVAAEGILWVASVWTSYGASYTWVSEFKYDVTFITSVKWVDCSHT